MIDPFLRYQKDFYIIELYPKKDDGYCDCLCGAKLKGRQTRWSSEECSIKCYREYSIIKGDSSTIRHVLFELEKGICQKCGIDCFQKGIKWDADHILEVHQGGGGCTIDNFQTLCISCHKKKTKLNRK